MILSSITIPRHI